MTMWQATIRAICNIITILLFMFLIFTLFVVISSKAAGGEPELFGYQLKTVLSGSMEPDIQTGAIISIKPGGDMTRFKKDDVITYRTKDEVIVTHRIVEVKDGGQQYITKGDNNDAPDSEPVLAENVIGHYTGWTIPYVGYVLHFANTKKGAALLLILPGILLFGHAVVTVWRTLQLVEVKEKEASANEN